MNDGTSTGTDRRIATEAGIDALRFDRDGLVPVVAQDARTGAVLMVAWANHEALTRTLSTRELHFWSRSRGELWHKGATSGNVLALVSMHADCDGDTVLAVVQPAGPACHTGETSCFGRGATRAEDGEAPVAPSDTVLPTLFATLEARAAERPEGSWTARLLDDPNLRIKKLGEETAELIQALVQHDRTRATEEAADLVYHTLVALLAEGITLDNLLAELARRR